MKKVTPTQWGFCRGMNIKRDALALHALGYSVLPVGTLGGYAKRPNYCLTETGHCRTSSRNTTVPCWRDFQGRQPTRKELETWFRTDHGRGVAVVTGAISGVVALDFDNPHGIKHLRELGVKPHTRTPGGGYHVLFRHPGRYVRTLNSKTSQQLGSQYPGLDIRGDGGYIICAGTTLSTGKYEQLRDYGDLEDLQLVPEAMQRALGLLEDRRDPLVETGARVELDLTSSKLVELALRDVQRGRNQRGFWLACQLRDARIPVEQALQAMQAYHQRVPNTNPQGQLQPYYWSEAEASLHSAYSHHPEHRSKWQPRSSSWR